MASQSTSSVQVKCSQDDEGRMVNVERENTAALIRKL